jgi:hypothetical protein
MLGSPNACADCRTPRNPLSCCAHTTTAHPPMNPTMPACDRKSTTRPRRSTPSAASKAPARTPPGPASTRRASSPRPWCPPPGPATCPAAGTPAPAARNKLGCVIDCWMCAWTLTESNDGVEPGEPRVADALRHGEAGDGDEVGPQRAERVGRQPHEAREDVAGTASP